MVYYGVYYGLFRILRTFIMEITVLLQGNLFTLERLSQIRPKTPTFVENRPKSGYFITDITEYYGYFGFFLLRNITENYGP